MEFDGQQTTLLALLAQNPDKDDPDVRRILKELASDPKVKLVAEVLVRKRSSNDDTINEAVAGLRTWAKSLA